jgi:TonB family protein
VNRRCARDVGLVAVATLLAAACASSRPVRGPTVDVGVPGHPYLETVRKQIIQRWAYPCVQNEATRACEYKSATGRVELGIRRDGSLAFVEITQSSGLAIYDARVLEAVRQAAPFPPVPDDLMARVPASSTAIPVNANFNYVAEPTK